MESEEMKFPTCHIFMPLEKKKNKKLVKLRQITSTFSLKKGNLSLANFKELRAQKLQNSNHVTF